MVDISHNPKNPPYVTTQLSHLFPQPTTSSSSSTSTPRKPAMGQGSDANTSTEVLSPKVPSIDLSDPDSTSLLVKACQEVGFFKIINYGLPTQLIAALEIQALKFFSLPLSDKQKAGPPNPLGYGDKNIGCNGDSGCVEYLLLPTQADSIHPIFSPISGHDATELCSAVNEYVTAVKEMACLILEKLAEGLEIEAGDVFSKLLMDKMSDSVFRVNHYQAKEDFGSPDSIGFGEHTDPQIISVLRSNDSPGFEIYSEEAGGWISIPSDQSAFFVNVGDTLQVMTNGRFKSVRHRVIAKSPKSRLSMIYFGGPALTEKIAPLPSLMEGEDGSLYKEFTWSEFKKHIYTTKLADYRLAPFEKTAASN